MRKATVRVLLAVTGLVLPATIAAVPSALAAPMPVTDPSWSAQVLPEQPSPTARLAAISCPTRATCFAAGSNLAPRGRADSLVLRGSGSHWTRMATPDAVGKAETYLTGISCASPTRCVAVGYAGETNIGSEVAFAIRWDGHRWSRIRPAFDRAPAGPGSGFTAVSCPAVDRCTAVGYAHNEGRPLIEEWNGRRWHVVTAPLPRGDVFGRLDSIDCVSTSFCVAGGQVQVKGRLTALTEQGGHGHYAYRRPPGRGIDLVGVSCSSTTSCLAVSAGFARTPPHAYRWNGTHWASFGIPGPTAASWQLTSIACTSATACTAAGYSYATSARKNARPLLAVRSAAGWRIARPGTGGDANGVLSGVACGRGFCTAAGQTGRRFLLPTRTSAVHTALVAEPVGSRGGTVRDVSCAPGGLCAAVGEGTLVRLRASAAGPWTLEHAVGPADLRLGSVSCPTASFCAVAGLRSSGSGVVEFRTDATWAVTSTPISNARRVECPSASFCFAWGSVSTAVWDDGTWTLEPLAVPAGADDVTVSRISCADATHCLALGVSGSDAGLSVVAERWDGSSWSLVAAPPVVETLSCPAPDQCLAVGRGSTGTLVTAVWNGSTWTQSDGPADPALSGFELTDPSDLSCATATTCTALLTAFTNERDCPEIYVGRCSRPLVADWDGAAWTEALLPLPPAATPDDTEGAAISCRAPSACTWVGVTTKRASFPVAGSR